ncbi:MAG: hypothetical protein JXR94_04915, partial [Candidatus Hydrogenedentes bacterium]|nr:hypothetical protein [Candidatus Hydrogenedentota bacterium]
RQNEDAAPVPPPAADPAAQLDRRELIQWVRAQLGEFPEKTREAMLLCYVEGYSVREAAAILDIRTAALKKRLQYGRQLLSDRVLHHLAEPDDERDRLKKHVLAAVPFGAAPWKAASAAATGVQAALGGLLAGKGALVFGIAAVAAVSASLWLAHSRLEPERQAAPAAQNAAAPSDVADAVSASAPAPDPGGSADSAAAFTGSATAGAGELVLHLQYGSGNANARSEADAQPVPGATVHLIPLRFDRAAFARAADALGIDEDARDALMWRATATMPSPDAPGRAEWEVLAQEKLAPLRELAEALKASDGDPVAEEHWEQLETAMEGTPVPRGVWRTGTSSGDGTATFAGIASGRYLAAVSPAGEDSRLYSFDPLPERKAYVPNLHRIAVHDGPRTELTLLVQDTVSTIEGVVVDAATGAPVERANLSLSGIPSEDLGVQTGADGRFSFSINHLGFGDYTIECTDSLHAPMSVSGRREPGVPIEHVIALQRRGIVYGYVRDTAENPVPRAAIMRYAIGGGGAQGIATTDDSGYYEAPHDGGPFRLCASAGRVRSEPAAFELTAGQSVEYSFTVPRAAHVTIEVNPGLFAKAIERFDYSILLTEDHTAGVALRNEAPNRFVLEHLPPGHYSLLLMKKGYDGVALDFAMDASLEDKTFTVELRAARPSIEVFVTNPGGTPEPDAGVVPIHISSASFRQDGSLSGGCYIHLSSLAVRTDERGRAVLEGLVPGLYQLHCGGVKTLVEIPASTPVSIQTAPEEERPFFIYLSRDDFRAHSGSLDGPRLTLGADSAHFVLASSGVLSNGITEPGESLLFVVKQGYTAAIQPLTVSEAEWADRQQRNRNGFDGPLDVVFPEGGGVYGVVADDVRARSRNDSLRVYPAALWPAPSNDSRWHTLGR